MLSSSPSLLSPVKSSPSLGQSSPDVAGCKAAKSILAEEGDVLNLSDEELFSSPAGKFGLGTQSSTALPDLVQIDFNVNDALDGLSLNDESCPATPKLKPGRESLALFNAIGTEGKYWHTLQASDSLSRSKGKFETLDDFAFDFEKEDVELPDVM